MWARRYRKVIKVASRGLSLLEGERALSRPPALPGRPDHGGRGRVRGRSGRVHRRRWPSRKELGDPALMVRVLSDRAVFHYYFFRLEDALADARAAKEAITQPYPPAVESWRLTWMEQALSLLGALPWRPRGSRNAWSRSPTRSRNRRRS